MAENIIAGYETSPLRHVTVAMNPLPRFLEGHHFCASAKVYRISIASHSAPSHPTFVHLLSNRQNELDAGDVKAMGYVILLTFRCGEVSGEVGSRVTRHPYG